MTVNISVVAGAAQQFFDNNGIPLAGGLLYTYAAGTTTPATTYTSNTGGTANSNPIVLDSAGRVPYEIWFTDGSYYKFVLKDSNGVLIGTYDNLSNASTVPGNLYVTGTIYATGGISVAGITKQIVQSVSKSTASTSGTGTTYVTTGHSASITPTSATSKILVTCTFSMKNSVGYDSGFTIYRGSTNLAGTATNFTHAGTYTGGESEFAMSMQYLDSPAVTSSTTYTVYMLNPGSPSTLTYNVGQGNGSQTGAAVITLLEIAQ